MRFSLLDFQFLLLWPQSLLQIWLLLAFVGIVACSILLLGVLSLLFLTFYCPKMCLNGRIHHSTKPAEEI